METRVQSLPFVEAIDFLRRKTDVPTEHWDDLWRGMHSRAFMVAGANTQAIVADFHNAINLAIEDGTTAEMFLKDFDKIVARYGWQYFGSRGWRSNLIYDTNLGQAYNAGRWKRQTDPEVLKLMPYLTYKHGDSIHPRPLHLSWHNITLRADDPWWQSHYPKNGWGCHCYVVSSSERDLERMGKTGPDEAPDNGTHEWKDRNGKVHVIPKGIDPGFDYNPGLEAYDYIPSQDKKVIVPGTGPLRKKKAPASLQEALDKHEPILIKRKTEKFMAFDASGRVMFEKSGGRSQVGFTEDECRRFAGLTCTHNHPSGSSFSRQDIHFSIARRIKEMRAVGRRYRYSIHLNPEGIAIAGNKDLNQIVLEAYYEADAHVRQIVTKKLNSGFINIDAANMIHYDLVWRRVAKKTNWFTYRRTKWQK